MVCMHTMSITVSMSMVSMSLEHGDGEHEEHKHVDGVLLLAPPGLVATASADEEAGRLGMVMVRFMLG